MFKIEHFPFHFPLLLHHYFITNHRHFSSHFQHHHEDTATVGLYAWKIVKGSNHKCLINQFHTVFNSSSFLSEIKRESFQSPPGQQFWTCPPSKCTAQRTIRTSLTSPPVQRQKADWCVECARVVIYSAGDSSPLTVSPFARPVSAHDGRAFYVLIIQTRLVSMY